MALKKKGPKGKRRRVISVDMEGVESGGKIVPDGNYTAKIEEITEEESKAENPMLVAKWRILSGKGKGGLVYDNISLTPQALWRLKGLCEALEIEVPDGSMDIDLGDLEGQECTIQVTNERFEGRDRPKVTGYGSVGEADEDEDEDEEEEDERVGKKPKKPARTSKKPVKDEDEDDDDDDDDDEDEDAEEDEEDDDEEEEDKKKPVRGKKPVRSKKPAAKESDSEFSEGDRVKFKDEDGKVLRGVILEIDDETVKVETKGGDEWEINVTELTAI
jgi:hypothetical protein